MLWIPRTPHPTPIPTPNDYELIISSFNHTYFTYIHLHKGNKSSEDAIDIQF